MITTARAIHEKKLYATTQDTDFKKTVKIIGICSINREEWLFTDLACNLLRISSVALYETLGDELLNMILNQTEMSTIFGSDKALIGILKILRKYID